MIELQDNPPLLPKPFMELHGSITPTVYLAWATQYRAGEAAAFARGSEARRVQMQGEIDRLTTELNALDKALRCEGWPLTARLERAEILSELPAKLKALEERKVGMCPTCFGIRGHAIGCPNDPM